MCSTIYVVYVSIYLNKIPFHLENFRKTISIGRARNCQNRPPDVRKRGLTALIYQRSGQNS